MHLEGYGLPGELGTYGLICQELEAGDSGIRSLVSVQGSLSMYAIGGGDARSRSNAGCRTCTRQEDRLLRADRAGRRLRSRLDAHDGEARRLRLDPQRREDVDHERLDRRRAVVWARTDGGEINGFLVEKDMPGFAAPLMHHKLSLRASVTSELVLRDVRVPEENRFPEISTLRGPLSCLNEARFGIVFGVVGSARACLETALDYAKERIVFDKPIAGYQLTQQKLAEMALEVNRGGPVALHLGRMKDEGTLRPEHVSMGKMGNVRGALDVARTARSVLGGNGITLEYPVIRHMNNLESVLTYEGTHEVHTLSVGKALTGENAFR